MRAGGCSRNPAPTWCRRARPPPLSAALEPEAPPSPWGCLPGPQGTGGRHACPRVAEGGAGGPTTVAMGRPTPSRRWGVNRPRVPEWVPPATWLPALGLIACGCGSGERLRVAGRVRLRLWRVPAGAGIGAPGHVAAGAWPDRVRLRLRRVSVGGGQGAAAALASARGWRNGCARATWLPALGLIAARCGSGDCLRVVGRVPLRPCDCLRGAGRVPFRPGDCLRGADRMPLRPWECPRVAGRVPSSPCFWPQLAGSRPDPVVRVGRGWGRGPPQRAA